MKNSNENAIPLLEHLLRAYMDKLDVYHEKKEQINLDFYLEFFHYPQIHFWRHGSGLMSNRDLFRRDGAHLNVNGTCKFFQKCCSCA
jgi:hypothetical protein